MYKVQTHTLAANELTELPDGLRGYMFRLIERLECEGPLKMPHYLPVGWNVFELQVGKNNAWSVFGCVQGDNIYLLQVFSKSSKPTPAKARKMAMLRVEDF
ncbi:type II toxin-antitoxin system RelE/ParE family toxin (plasmid) [Rouxiella badensis]|uniref:Addiction module toxin RelE n=1 Tax=Rouxiella badensis TaxID=1646377 RepID=A0A1X0WAY0_9GAMM|nr:type II toxin-antitoxin system RelE/ParE family toxin [Rouxiella badensis]ORJ23929.1 hypothetical protein BS640_18670 [Rouxiella badensis]WAT03179.1 type II toxin-antitoxin system RelE/ParE family toxin [Rouxiella badensis]WAT03301.1 type II toxin-antitoxin system RelE/ParE family toxin [Rouxiella badensis]